MSLPMRLSEASACFQAAAECSEGSDYAQAATRFASGADALFACATEALCSAAGAYVSAEQYDAAVDTAERAIAHSALSAPAWYWKGMALMKGGAHAKAKASFEKAVEYEKQLAKKTAYMDCIARCDELEKEAEKNESAGARNAADGVTMDISRGENAGSGESGVVGTEQGAVEERAAQPPKPKDPTRMQWYQSAEYVTIDIYAKNVDKAGSTVDISATSLSVRLQRPDKPEYVLQHELFEEVVPASSTWSASKFKVEIRLRKVKTGVSWTALDRDAEEASVRVLAAKAAAKRMENTAIRQKTWNSVADKELKDYKEDDSAMSVFRQIFASADEDTRRAMAKSYSESGGQVLSTDWNDVRKRKVEYKPKDRFS